LSEGEKNRMNQLAIAEAGYRNQLDQISAQGEQARLTKKAPGNLADLYSSIFG